mgnify:CR=1 FL=1
MPVLCERSGFVGGEFGRGTDRFDFAGWDAGFGIPNGDRLPSEYVVVPIRVGLIGFDEGEVVGCDVGEPARVGVDAEFRQGRWREDF